MNKFSTWKRFIVSKALVLSTFAATANIQAALVSIDFDALPAGTVVTDQFALQGVEFALLNGAPVAGPTTTAISNVTYPQASAPNAIVPGDNLQDPFFDIELSFTRPINFFSLDVFDADEFLTVRAFFGVDELLMWVLPPGVDLQHYHIAFSSGIRASTRFDRVVLDVTEGVAGDTVGGPEYFDNLRFNPWGESYQVAEPTTLMLISLGLGVVASGISRRRRLKPVG